MKPFVFWFASIFFAVLCGDAPFNLSAAETAFRPEYKVIREPKVPCDIHVIIIPRKDLQWQVQTVHADGSALGLEKLSGQLARLDQARIIAAINGDYYVRQGTFAGDPRGLQIVRGELISAPSEGASFWIDALDQPNVGITSTKFAIVWPDGSSTPFELNAPGTDNGFVLYTPAVGESLKSRGGIDLILEREPNSPWLPLRPGRTYTAKVRTQQKAREIQITDDVLILSAGRRAKLPKFSDGAILKISTDTQPSLRGVSEAVSGGPILVQNGKRVPIKAVESDSYIFSSMKERHPRSAIGWNDDYYFLVSVDGRKPGVSEGLTLEEFSSQLVKIGCKDALNLDGGGSATLWFDGKVRNHLCDGYERKIANGLSFVEKKKSR